MFKEFRHRFIVNDNFSEYKLCVPLKYNYGETISNEFSNFLRSSKKTIKIESDRGKDFYNNIFQNFSKVENVQNCS